MQMISFDQWERSSGAMKKNPKFSKITVDVLRNAWKFKHIIKSFWSVENKSCTFCNR